MSIFKDSKEDLQNEEKDDLFTMVSEEDQEEEVDLELLDSLMEDDSLVEAETKEEEPVKEELPKEKATERPSEADTEGVTVITKGTTINGSIISDCSLDVMGTINGDIECLGKLTISGKVTGNAKAAEGDVNMDR